MRLSQINNQGRPCCPYCAGSGKSSQYENGAWVSVACRYCNGEGLGAYTDTNAYKAEQEDADVAWHREQTAAKGVHPLLALGAGLARDTTFP